MISRADVERLRVRDPIPGSPVLSVYLDVDQARAANLNRRFAAGLKARLRTVAQQLAESEREAFRADAARVQAFVADYEPHAKTLVIFADDSAGLFWSGELRAALPTDVRWDARPHLRPLLEALDQHPRYGVALVDKERARIFTVFLREIEEAREALAAAEVRHKKSSGTDHLRSQMHFQRQDDMHVRWHVQQVGELLEEVAREQGFDRLVLAGPVEATSELARALPRPLAERVVGTVRIPFAAAADQVLRDTLELTQRVERDAEQARIAQLMERGTIGLDATLSALQEGRVWIVLHADGFESRGTECPRCGALFPSDSTTSCRYCGERLRPLEDLVGRALERAGESGARVETVHGEAALRLLDAGGIGGDPPLLRSHEASHT
jgi:peptide chain release factor subunit 1